MSQAYLYCGTGVSSISWQLVNSSGTVLQTGTCTSTSSVAITGQLYRGNKIKFTNIVVKSGCNSATLKWHYNSGSSTSPTNSYTYGNNYTSCTMDYTGYNRYGYWTADKNTTYDTVKVKVSSAGVTATVWYYDDTNTYRELTLSAGGSLTFYARSGRTSGYAGVTDIEYISGYTTPITWQYNTSSGGTQTTTIPNGGYNNIDTTYARTIHIYATTAPVATRYTITLYRNSTSSDSTSNTIETEATTSSTKSVYLGTPSEYGWTKSGYRFVYWTTGRSGTGTVYYGGQNQSFTGNKTLYAQWEEVSYTYYYRINLFIDGSLYDYETDYTTSTASTGVNISLSTAQGYFNIGSGYSFSYASAGANCTYSNGYFTITSTSSSSRSICNLYYKTNTYTYLYTVRLFLDGSFNSSVNGSVSTTESSGHLTLTDAQAKFSISAKYQFSSASAGNSYASYSSTYQQFTLTSTSNRGYCDLYYTTKTYTVGATYGTGYSGMYSSITVNNAGSATVEYGSTATWRCTPATGHTFVGWYSDAACTSFVSSSAEYSETIYSSKTLYAKLKANTYSAHAYSTGFESCFSSISVSSSSPTYGSSITFKAVLSNSSGYTFLGWYNGTGSGASRVSQSLSYTHTVTGSVTLYARARVKWTYSHAAGTKQISKEEWDRVQAFIHDRNGATFSYTATAGSALSKNLYNDTKDAIGTGTTVKKGQVITQALLDALVTNANNL